MMADKAWKLPAQTGYLAIAFAAIALVVMFSGSLVEMWEDWQDPEYNHGYAIPLISLYLLWIRAADLRNHKLRGSWAGIALIAVALFAYVAGDLSSIYVVSQYAMLLMILGAVVATIGWRGAWILWAGLFYLVFMIPLPVFIQNALTADLQLWSSQLGTHILRSFGITVHLQGNIIDLGTYKLQVVEACSGLRYLFPLLSLGFLFAYLFRGATWQRLFVFLSAVPITILMNSLRIAAIGVLVNQYGTDAADGFLHFFEGWVVFMACIGILLFEMWIFGRMKSNQGRELFAVEIPPLEDLKLLAFARHITAPMVAVGVLFGGGVVFSGLLAERVEAVPERAPFAEFPMVLGGWVGSTGTLRDVELEVLKLSDYIIGTYRRAPREMPIELYVAYYDSQRQGSAAHSPRACIPGSGWRISDFAQKQIADVLPDGSALPINRAVISMGDNNLLVYYLFMQRGRFITNEYLVKWFIFWDSITKNRTDGALVRVMTPFGDIANVAEADQRLEEFLRVVEPKLAYFIPQDNAIPAVALLQ